MSRIRQRRIGRFFVRQANFWLLGAFMLSACLIFDGCRRPRIQQSLSPELRGPVNDLTAVRSSNQIWLSWTMPSRRVRNLLVNGSIKVRVCRRETAAGDCVEAGKPLDFGPGATGSFSEELPAVLSLGTPRALYYSVELLDRKGKSTGLSDIVPTLAGAPPPVIRGLTAELTDRGVLLRWPADTSSDSPSDTAVRLHRNEVYQTPASEGMREGFSPPSSAAAGEDLLVEGGSRSGRALDANIHRGSTYEYRAQRVVRVAVRNQIIEMAGQISPPVQIDTADGPH
jgi:hypothetical protein